MNEGDIQTFSTKMKRIGRLQTHAKGMAEGSSLNINKITKGHSEHQERKRTTERIKIQVNAVFPLAFSE